MSAFLFKKMRGHANADEFVRDTLLPVLESSWIHYYEPSKEDKKLLAEKGVRKIYFYPASQEHLPLRERKKIPVFVRLSMKRGAPSPAGLLVGAHLVPLHPKDADQAIQYCSDIPAIKHRQSDTIDLMFNIPLNALQHFKPHYEDDYAFVKLGDENFQSLKRFSDVGVFARRAKAFLRLHAGKMDASYFMRYSHFENEGHADYFAAKYSTLLTNVARAKNEGEVKELLVKQFKVPVGSIGSHAKALFMDAKGAREAGGVPKLEADLRNRSFNYARKNLSL